MMHALKSIPTLTFGDILRKERESQGLTHHDLAHRCSVDKATVKAWEAGKAYPNSDDLKNLFTKMRRLRHYVMLIPNEATRKNAEYEARNAGDPLPKQLAPIDTDPAPAPPQSFTEALVRERLHVGFSIEDVADVMGVVRNAVYEWETGKSNPVREHLDKLYEIFPALRHAPPPASRDIEKPAGQSKTKAVKRPATLFNAPQDFMTAEEIKRAQEAVRVADVVVSVAPIPPNPEQPIMASFIKPPTVDLTPAPIEPELAQVAPPAVNMKAAMLRWGKLLFALKMANNTASVVELLSVAKSAGLTLDEVIEQLSEDA